MYSSFINMFSAVARHIYLLLTFQHNGKNLATSIHTTIFIFILAALSRSVNIAITGQEVSIIVSIISMGIVTAIFYKFFISDVVNVYLLLTVGIYILMSISFLFIGNELDMFFFIFQFVAFLRVIVIINKEKNTLRK